MGVATRRSRVSYGARTDDGETEAPDAAHQVHAKQAGDQKIDIAGAGFAQQLVAGGNWVGGGG